MAVLAHLIRLLLAPRDKVEVFILPLYFVFFFCFFHSGRWSTGKSRTTIDFVIVEPSCTFLLGALLFRTWKPVQMKSIVLLRSCWGCWGCWSCWKSIRLRLSAFFCFKAIKVANSGKFEPYGHRDWRTPLRFSSFHGYLGTLLVFYQVSFSGNATAVLKLLIKIRSKLQLKVNFKIQVVSNQITLASIHDERWMKIRVNKTRFCNSGSVKYSFFRIEMK